MLIIFYSCLVEFLSLFTALLSLPWATRCVLFFFPRILARLPRFQEYFYILSKFVLENAVIIFAFSVAD